MLLRNDLESFPKRRKTLVAKIAQDGLILTNTQVSTLDRKKQNRKAGARVKPILSYLEPGTIFVEIPNAQLFAPR
ncbi:MAG: hypothetical protein JWQ54_2180 [Mucilaginibacter sp.]|nr:hypothetical protein [Mucilaginibacter sp.]